MTGSGLEGRLKARALELGFDRAGIARLGPSEQGDFYRRWLAYGYHGEMSYLAREDAVDRRLDPTRAYPELRSALVVGQNYFPGNDEDPDVPAGLGIIARYARGRDYHKVMKSRLLELLRWLEAEVGRPMPLARAAVDTAPVLERELAQRAGIGWQGRNAMLIDPRAGSWFFLGSLMLDLDLDPDPPFVADRCGSCNACVNACPTGALLGRDEAGGPVVDARRCISYLTIELRGPIPRELRPAIGNRIFGCDICQSVCPFNSPKFVRLTREPGYLARGSRLLERPGSGSGAAALRSGRTDSDSGSDSDPACADLRSAAVTSGGPRPPSVAGGTASGSRAVCIIPGTSGPALLDLIGMDEAAWDEFSRGSAIRRARRAGFLRNVAVALGNWGSPEAVPGLVRALSDPEPLVRGHAAWALGRIGTAAAMSALRARDEIEREGSVREELAVALAGNRRSES